MTDNFKNDYKCSCCSIDNCRKRYILKDNEKCEFDKKLEDFQKEKERIRAKNLKYQDKLLKKELKK